MLEIVTITVTDFAQNCRIIGHPESKTAVVVDPGGDSQRISAELDRRGWMCKEVWLTHSHIDHCGGVAAIQRKYGAKLVANPLEKELRQLVLTICEMYGLRSDAYENCPEPDVAIRGGETLHFGGHDFTVSFTPGHSPGHVVFYQQQMGVLIAGDTLFAGSIGRSDLPGGDYETLMRSLREVLLKFPDETRVLPGHGEDTTIGRERVTNPFLQEA